MECRRDDRIKHGLGELRRGGECMKYQDLAAVSVSECVCVCSHGSDSIYCTALYTPKLQWRFHGKLSQFNSKVHKSLIQTG
jgi:hypothetical protein